MIRQSWFDIHYWAYNGLMIFCNMIKYVEGIMNFRGPMVKCWCNHEHYVVTFPQNFSAEPLRRENIVRLQFFSRKSSWTGSYSWAHLDSLKLILRIIRFRIFSIINTNSLAILSQKPKWRKKSKNVSFDLQSFLHKW